MRVGGLIGCFKVNVGVGCFLNRILKGVTTEGIACFVFVYFVVWVYQRAVGFGVFQMTAWFCDCSVD